MSIDDNALFRHRDIEALREHEPDGRLDRAHHGFNYIALDGDIGCVVNGAGLAMATMDILELHGGAPANFLDVPPAAGRDRITAACRLVLENPRVKAMLVNVVGGGITRCDAVAEALAAACRAAGRSVPIVARFEGVNRELARKVLRDTGVGAEHADSLGDAATPGGARRRRSGGELTWPSSSMPARGVVCQGITGAQGTFHTEQSIAYGTRVVAGVTPGKGGSRHLYLPVYDRVADAVEATGADASAIYVPPEHAADAMLEAIHAGIEVVVCVTEGVPVLDMVRVKRALEGSSTTLIGPNTPGIITPGACRIGIMPGLIHRRGRIGIVSRSGTLTYEAAAQCTALGLGQSTVVGIGADRCTASASSTAEAVPRRRRDGWDHPHRRDRGGRGGDGGHVPRRCAPVEAGGGLRRGHDRPGRPPHGHAGAIISGGRGSAREKLDALRGAGVLVPDSPADIARTMARALASAR